MTLTVKEVMKSCAKAFLAAFWISSSDAPGLPRSMFSLMEPVKSTGSCQQTAKGRGWSTLTQECVPSKWDGYGPTTYGGGKISIHPTMSSTIRLFWSAWRFREESPKSIPDPRSPSTNAAGVHNTAKTRANRGKDESTRHGRTENTRGARRKRDQYREQNAVVYVWVSVICSTKGFQFWTVKLDGSAVPHQEQPKD